MRLMERSKAKESCSCARKALGEIAAGGARGVVSLVDVRADLNPLRRLVGGWRR